MAGLTATKSKNTHRTQTIMKMQTSRVHFRQIAATFNKV